MEPRAPQTTLLGVSIDRLVAGDVVAHVTQAARAGRGGAVYSVNLDTLRQAHASDEVRELFEAADLRIPDGMPLIWAAGLSGQPLPERVPGSTLVSQLACRAAEVGLRVFLLGGDEGKAEAASLVLQSSYPGLQVAGTHFPPFGFEKSEVEVERAKASVVSAAPDIVFVGLPFPKQERLIDQLRLAAPDAWYISCGITFSFLTGDVKRAPMWIQQIGLEWLHRFSQEPRRLFRRYFLQDIPFLFTLLRAAGRRRRQLGRLGA